MKDDIANYRLVELSKQKGFVPETEIDYSDGESWEQRITLSLLQKWVREKHRINIAPSFKMNIDKWDYIVYDMNLNGKEFVIFYKEYYKETPKRQYDTYEDALAVGLEEALNLLPDVKKD